MYQSIFFICLISFYYSTFSHFPPHISLGVIIDLINHCCDSTLPLNGTVHQQMFHWPAGCGLHLSCQLVQLDLPFRCSGSDDPLHHAPPSSRSQMSDPASWLEKSPLACTKTCPDMEDRVNNKNKLYQKHFTTTCFLAIFNWSEHNLMSVVNTFIY